MTFSRRDFGKCALAVIPGVLAFGAKPDSVVNGVILGLMTNSFHRLPLDDVIKATADVGFSYVELTEALTEPPRESKESAADYTARIQKWLMTVSLDHFRTIHTKFSDAGIRLWAFTHVFKPEDSDEQIDRTFQIARTLGVKYIFTSTQAAAMPRVEPFAAKYDIPVGMHNHSGPYDEIASPADFARGMMRNPHIGINLDIGHFVAAGYDPVDFIAKHHDQIFGLHVKDRRRGQGPNMPFGQGDTPIVGVLQLLKTNQYKIPALIEWEIPVPDPVEEVRQSYEYMRRAIA